MRVAIEGGDDCHLTPNRFSDGLQQIAIKVADLVDGGSSMQRDQHALDRKGDSKAVEEVGFQGLIAIQGQWTAWHRAGEEERFDRDAAFAQMSEGAVEHAVG